MGILTSVPELRRTHKEQLELRVKRSHKYWGATSCRDLKTIVLDLVVTSCWMVFQPSWSISGLRRLSKLHLVMIRAARLWSHCNCLSSVKQAQPQTEQQYRKYGLIIPPSVRVFNVSCRRNVLACFKKPIALETLVVMVLICSCQLRQLLICKARYFIFFIISSSLLRIPNLHFDSWRYYAFTWWKQAWNLFLQHLRRVCCLQAKYPVVWDRF